MNLDLNHVQAFVTAAEMRHFGCAARRLHLTQQGLSHRVARLEHVLGERLFVRDGRAVELTPAGQRFLPHARRLLATAEVAVAETRQEKAPLRVDVWGELHAPLRWIARLPALDRQVPLNVSVRRDTGAAIDALQQGELDAAFGLLPDRRLGPALRHAFIGVEPMGVVVGAAHRLAGRTTVAAEELAGSTLWLPGTGTPPEVIGYYRQLAARLGMRPDESGNNLGLYQMLAVVARRPDRLAVLPMGIDERCVPVTGPTPYTAWMMIWRTGNRDTELAALRTALTRAAAPDAPATWDPATCWLPEADRAALAD